ncbi:MAG: 30S ribosomal protein S8 [Candidatus Gracilibacteria bacterium]|jgi:small subunit ribosomal protein S8|nr:30S ribosomal protein S8 [Candidatus Gracilibacteria bacterium]
MNTDPIADLLTRIRNAFQARQEFTLIPHSNLKIEICKILEKNGFLDGVKLIQDKETKQIKAVLPKDKKELTLKRVSSPGRRMYVKSSELKPSLNGFGIFVLSTSRGVLTGAEAKEQNIGGELLCEVY